MKKKAVSTHKRALLLKTTSEKKLSVNTQQEISEIIKNTRLQLGHEAAEKKAEELTELINNSKTEAEIIKAIAKI